MCRRLLRICLFGYVSVVVEVRAGKFVMARVEGRRSRVTGLALRGEGSALRGEGALSAQKQGLTL